MELTRFRGRQHLSALRYVENVSTCGSMDAAVRLIGERFAAPMVQVNVLTADQQFTIAAVGGPVGAKSRAGTLCTHVVRDGRVKLLSDIHPLPARASHIKAYLGVPLKGREGLVIGVLCLLDTVPRTFTPAEVRDLLAMAPVIQDQLELMRRVGAAHCGTSDDAAELATAVCDGHIVPFYQPIVDLETGRVAGVEALARWRHPTRGLLAPAAFIPQAEDSDIILDLDLSILRQAAAQLGSWNRRHPQLRLSVNLSAAHFNHPDRRHGLRTAAGSASIDPALVTLELTETAALAPDPSNHRLLRDLRLLGFRLVLDDFGSGFASVEQIIRLPIDGIKLDRTLTAAMGSRVGDAVLRHLVALAGDLDLSTVVEGIEEADQREQARRIGATSGQGFLWAPALSAADMTTYLETNRRGCVPGPAEK